MRALTISYQTPSFAVVTLKSEETVLYNNRLMVTSLNQKTKLSQILRIEVMTLENMLTKLTPTEPITVDLDLLQAIDTAPQTLAEPFNLVLRGRLQSADQGLPYNHTDPRLLIQELLTSKPALSQTSEPLITWKDSTRLAVLDIDYHHGYIPPRDLLELWIGQTNPAPFAYHLSHGGGVKLFYAQQDYINADELAAAAALNWRSFEPFGETEICTSSRHPLFTRNKNGETQECGPVRFLSPTTDLPALTDWLQQDIPEYKIDEFLNEYSFSKGQRYPHSRCLIDPYETASDTPVFVGDLGVHCFVCAAKGKTYGFGRKPGFVAYNQVLRGTDNTIKNLVRHFTHWEHAKHILRAHVNVPLNLLQLGYSALLKIWHANDERISQVFYSGSNMLRFRGTWVSADGATTYSRNITAMIAALPATQYLTDKGPKPSLSLVQEFNERGDLTDKGYPEITPVRGSLLFGVHNVNENVRYPLAMPHPTYKKCPPTYYKAKDRPSPEQAYAFLTSVYQGIDLNYVKLLVALKGSVENGQNEDPFIFTTGPSGSGKSNTAKVVAAILGDHCAEPLFQPNIERFRQGIMEGVDSGSFVAVNEFLKEAEANKLSPIAACNPLLSLTADSLSHKPYVGPVRLGTVPVLILTDTSTPASLGHDMQISRRLFYHRLPSRCYWRDSSKAFGLSTFEALRLKYPQECDYVYSTLVDELFLNPRKLSEIAAELGIPRLEAADYGDGNHSSVDLISLYELVCKAPPLTESQKAQFGGPGWVAIAQSDTTDLRDAWDLLADTNHGEGWFQSRRCSEADWGRILNTSDVAPQLQTRKRKGTLYLRFIVGSAKQPEFVNAEIPRKILESA